MDRDARPNSERTHLLAQTIAGITGLDLFYRCRGSWNHIHSSQTPIDVLTALEPESIGEQFSRSDAETTLVTDDYGFSWITGSNQHDLLVIGPFLEGTLTERGAQFLMRHPTLPPSRSQEEIQGVANLLLLTNAETDEAGAATIHHADISGIHNPAAEELNQLDAEHIEGRYQYERRIRDAVARGDRHALSQVIGEGFETRPFYHRLPGNPLRIEKNLTVVLNTILRNSAETGGLLPILVHGISDQFAVRIEQARHVEEMAPLRTEMMYHYCEAVRRFTVAHHTTPVRLVTSHILTDLSADHTLEGLSQVAGCSPSYLSRLFRQEHGLSVGAFIREKRISEARWLLAQSDQPLAEIADMLGFNSLTYFRRVFKKETGTTPGLYRRRYRNV